MKRGLHHAPAKFAFPRIFRIDSRVRMGFCFFVDWPDPNPDPTGGRTSVLAPREAQNDARPEYRAILQGECALGAVEGRFGLPGRFMCIGSRTLAQGAHTSATKALGVRNGQLSSRWSLLTTPLSKTIRATNPQSVGVRADSRGPWASPGVPLEWLGRLQFVPGGLEGENRILEAATESPTAVFDACGAAGHVPSRAARLTLCRTRVPVLGLSSAVEHAIGSGRVSFADPGRRLKFSRAPRRSVRQSAWSAPARSRARRARAVLADPKGL